MAGFRVISLLFWPEAILIQGPGSLNDPGRHTGQWVSDIRYAAQDEAKRLLPICLLTSADLWLWRDGIARPIVIEMRIPGGMSISAPWNAQTGLAKTSQWLRAGPRPHGGLLQFSVRARHARDRFQ